MENSRQIFEEIPQEAAPCILLESEDALEQLAAQRESIPECVAFALPAFSQNLLADSMFRLHMLGVNRFGLAPAPETTEQQLREAVEAVNTQAGMRVDFWMRVANES